MSRWQLMRSKGMRGQQLLSGSRRALVTAASAGGLSYLVGCATGPVAVPPPLAGVTPDPAEGAAAVAPAAPREFRAAWVATVANIDWPSRKGLGAAAQQSEMRALLDRAKALKLNAIILQVRPCADAFYPSDLEPWSEYLSGVQGQPPSPSYDPLALWISEAHARGMELHAWFNPFRAKLGDGKSTPSPRHVSQTRPQWVKTYGNQWWMDPGEPDAVAHSLSVMLDVLARYDVDGIHLDDYFYPYPITSSDDARLEIDFPDQPSWQRYQDGGGSMTRDDWRRNNVDGFLERLFYAMRRIKPWVRLGISPFGIGRPELRPPGIVGFSQYHKLYADVERWLQQGWLDYLVPQLYWPLDQKEQAFIPLLDYWHRQNMVGRHVWAGLYTSRVSAAALANATKSGWPADEISNQIAATRQRAPGTGHVHFSMVALMQNRQGLADQLQAGPYASAALVPASPWIESDAPAAPLARLQAPIGLSGPLRISLQSPTGSKAVTRWCAWLRYGQRWQFLVSVSSEFNVLAHQDLSKGTGSQSVESLNAIVVSAVDRVGNESPRVAIDMSQIGL